ncbi:MAG TPA: ion channel [Terriglobales bacterium]|nr:ion channel [Terriglobales bacterium]
MSSFATISGVIILLAVLLDAFETVVLPRRIARHFRLTAWFYRRTWIPWRRLASKIPSQVRRESFLGYFGPLSLIFLLIFWAAGLIFGFALVQYGTGEHVQLGGELITFGALVYHSGETFFTLGYGDIVPTSSLSRALSVAEAGTGFALLGAVIGYLPTIYGAFSRREIQISLLDARSGSPPTAAELLGRFGNCPSQEGLDRIFLEWEHWAAEVLESHLSYPVLSFYRSQHNNQSWLGALTTILDASALIIMGVDGLRKEQAKLTFAMARHAVVDLAQVLNARYDPQMAERLTAKDMEELRRRLTEAGVKLRSDAEAEEKLSQLRALYEPYAQAMARTLLITLPPWMYAEKRKDNWQSGPWDRAIQARSLGGLGHAARDDHF